LGFFVLEACLAFTICSKERGAWTEREEASERGEGGREEDRHLCVRERLTDREREREREGGELR